MSPGPDPAGESSRVGVAGNRALRVRLAPRPVAVRIPDPLAGPGVSRLARNLRPGRDCGRRALARPGSGANPRSRAMHEAKSRPAPPHPPWLPCPLATVAFVKDPKPGAVHPITGHPGPRGRDSRPRATGVAARTTVEETPIERPDGPGPARKRKARPGSIARRTALDLPPTPPLPRGLGFVSCGEITSKSFTEYSVTKNALALFRKFHFVISGPIPGSRSRLMPSPVSR